MAIPFVLTKSAVTLRLGAILPAIRILLMSFGAVAAVIAIRVIAYVH